MLSKKNLLIIIVVGLTLSIFSNDVWGENLIEYFEDEYGTIFYYDKDSVKQTSGKVRVWVTERWGEEKNITKERMTQQGISTENFEKVSLSRILFELNCREQTYHILTNKSYDKEGNIIQTVQKTDWNYVIPHSVMDTLKRTVCK